MLKPFLASWDVEVSSNWPEVPLGDVVDFFDKDRVPLSKMQRATRQGVYPYYGASGVIDWVDDFLFDGRYLLVAEDGENLNSRKLPVAFFADGKFWVNNHAHIVRAKRGVADDDFLHAWFAQANLGGYITGAAQPKLSQGSMKRIEIQLPPVPTQKRIGTILAAYDDLIENDTRRIKILEEMAQAIYREWFVNFRYPGHESVPLVDSALGAIPEGWEPQPASTAIEVNPRNQAVSGNQITFVPMGSISETTLHIGQTEVRSRPSGPRFSNGDTLFARITPCLENGKTAFVKLLVNGEVACGSTEFIVLRSKTLSPEFVYLLARSESFRSHAIASMSGATGRQRVRNECFDSYLVAVPPPAILDLFSQIVAPMFQQSFSFFLANEVLRQFRDLLLPRLVSGEVKVGKP